MKFGFLALLFTLLAGCVAAVEPVLEVTPVQIRKTAASGESAVEAIGAESPVVKNRRVAVSEDYVFAISLGFDAIRPVYNPQFSSAESVRLSEDELVLGIAWDGKAKAYPISVLRYREMVDDEMAGIPTLVTW